nr:MAG TPA: hypothetical protein [Caudoviricetes sp.]
MADITIHGQTYTGVKTVKYFNGANTYDLEKLILNGTVVFEKEPDFPAKKALSLMTWKDISTVCKAGKASEYWAVGDTKDITVNGATYAVMIIGFDHDEPTDAASYGRSKAGITLQTVHVISGSYKMCNTMPSTASWKTATLRTTLNSTILGTMESDLTSVIVPVNKNCREKAYDSDTYTTVSDKLFVLSSPECAKNQITTDGTLYTYFNSNSAAKTDPGGGKQTYWTRTSGYNLQSYSATFDRVLTGGSINTYASPTSVSMVAFAFCV